MARIPYLTDEEATDDQRAVIEARKEIFGRDSAFQRIVTRTPRVAGWFLPFSLALQRGGAGGLLDGRTKELAVLKTSLVNACSFCSAHNVSLGQAVGLSMEQIESLSADYQASPVLSDRDKAVVRWAEVVTLNEARSDHAAFAELKKHFSDDEIVELTWVSALFNMVNRINDALWLDVEEKDLEGIRQPVDEAGVLKFVRRMLEHAEASAAAAEPAASPAAG
jgi:uncharacterized peroxidase-related enzyme